MIIILRKYVLVEFHFVFSNNVKSSKEEFRTSTAKIMPYIELAVFLLSALCVLLSKLSTSLIMKASVPVCSPCLLG